MNEFEELVKELELEDKIRYCYQCGTCTGGCPIAALRNEYSPRRTLEALVQGHGESLVSDEKVWLCTLCHTCLERCPQRVAVSEVCTKLKNFATRIGNVPGFEVAKLRMVLETGRVIPTSAPIDRRREQLKLPKVQQTVGTEDLAAIVEATGLKAILDGGKEWPAVLARAVGTE